jgi:ABC-type siderophore export system fused ATPase/permease subunit
MNEKIISVAAVVVAIISVVAVVAVGITVTDLKATVDHQDKLLANVTAITKLYQEVFISHNEQLNVINNQMYIIENNTISQVRFNENMLEWGQDIESRVP